MRSSPCATVICSIVALSLLSSCDDASPDADPSGDNEGGLLAPAADAGTFFRSVADCHRDETSFDGLPSQVDGVQYDPAELVTALSGHWSNSQGDTLVVERAGPLTLTLRSGRLSGGGTMPKDCSYYSEFTLPLQLALTTKDGRVNETFASTLHLDLQRHVHFSAELPLRGNPVPDAPNDSTLSLRGQYSASWPWQSNVPQTLSGQWAVSASVAGKLVVMGNSAGLSTALIWIDDFKVRSEGFAHR